MTTETIPPKYELDGFNCPHCQAFSKRRWSQIFLNPRVDRIPTFLNGESRIAFCDKCGKFSIWIDGEMVYPKISIAPLPNIDMPENVKVLFEEARSLYNISPRASAAYLRLPMKISTNLLALIH
jgi:hypothetical protein